MKITGRSSEQNLWVNNRTNPNHDGMVEILSFLPKRWVGCNELRNKYTFVPQKCDEKNVLN